MERYLNINNTHKSTIEMKHVLSRRSPSTMRGVPTTQIHKPTEAKQTHRPDTKENTRIQTNRGVGRHLALALAMAVMPWLCECSAALLLYDPYFQAICSVSKTNRGASTGWHLALALSMAVQSQPNISISSVHWLLCLEIRMWYLNRFLISM